MGFGSGTFGSGPFGASDWAKKALYDSLPEVYRNLDSQNNNLLEKWSSGIGIKFQEFREKIDNFTDIKNPNLVASRHTNATQLRLGRVLDQAGDLLQSGISGTVDGSGNFSAKSVRFSKADVGRSISLQSISAASTNNSSFQITAVLTSTSVSLQPYPQAESNLSWQLHDRVSAVDYTTIEVAQGDISNIVEGSILYDGSNEFNIISRSQFPSSTSKLFVIDREGSDGFFYRPSDMTSTLVFASSTALFTQNDIGKIISIPGLNAFEDMVRYRVSNTVTSTDLSLTGYSLVTLTYESLTPTILSTDIIVPQETVSSSSSPLYWCIFNRPTITIQGTVRPRGVITNTGPSGLVSSTALTLVDNTRNNFNTSYSGNITTLYVPKSTGMVISEVVNRTATYASSSTLTLDSSPYPSAVGIVSPIYYELRTPSTLSDSTCVGIFSPNILSFLAQEIGATFDALESDQRQRALTRHLLDWAEKKGQADSYRIVGALSGWNTSAQQVYRVDRNTADGLKVPIANIFLDDTDIYRQSSGAISPSYHLIDYADLFTADMVGNFIRVNRFINPLNDGVYTILSFVSSNEIVLSATPVAHSGELALSWFYLKSYSLNGPQSLRAGDASLVAPDTLAIYDSYFNDAAYPYSCYPATHNFPTIKLEIMSVTSKNVDGTWTVVVRDILAAVIEKNLFIPNGEVVTKSTGTGSASLAGTSLPVNIPGQPHWLNKVTALFTGAFPDVVTSPSGLGTIYKTVFHSPKIITAIGYWNITDSSGNNYWVESLPSTGVTDGTYPLQTRYSIKLSSILPTPALGLASLNYAAPIVPLVGFHTESVVLLKAEEVDSSIAKDQFLARIKEVTPLNVRLIVQTTYTEGIVEAATPIGLVESTYSRGIRTYSNSIAESPSPQASMALIKTP